jgi:hypothetical protein
VNHFVGSCSCSSSRSSEGDIEVGEAMMGESVKDAQFAERSTDQSSVSMNFQPGAREKVRLLLGESGD